MILTDRKGADHYGTERQSPLPHGRAGAPPPRPETAANRPLFGATNNPRSRKQATPGDVLTLHCELVEQRGPVGIGKASAYVDGKCAATAELTFVLTGRTE